MQTNFTLAQLADADVAASEKILRNCVHCGFCTATCPTYVLYGDELDSPRGRIYLIKNMLEKDAPPPAEVVKHIDRCLSCLSCMTTCPSGVNYMHLVDHARKVIAQRHVRPVMARILRGLLVRVLPNPSRFRLALMAARLGRPFAGLLPGRLRAMMALAPKGGRISAPILRPRIFPAQGQRRARVAMLAGCAQQVLAPQINDATIRLLTRQGVEVVVAKGAGCCGALTYHMGQEAVALTSVKANIAAWMGELEGDGLDAVVINASGCGTMVKDYGYMLRDDSDWAAPAAKIAGLARDVSEFIAGLNLPPVAQTTALTVAYHAACSLQHGQKITREPKALLRDAGFTVKDIPEGHLCCGSAGTYNLLQSETASRLRDRKVKNIARLTPDVIAMGNIGCMTQLAAGTDIPIVHSIELLDWAHGGPVPSALTHLAVTKVRGASAEAAE